MTSNVNLQYRPAGSATPPAGFWAMSTRWYVRIGLLLLSTVLLTASFAPYNQFYLAWIGVVPWLIVLDGTASKRSAFFWSWLAGTFFFIANMWWMYSVTSYGMVALMAILGLYWGYAGIIIYGLGLLGRGRTENRGSRIENRELKVEGGEPPAFSSVPSSVLDYQSSGIRTSVMIFALPRRLRFAIAHVAIWLTAWVTSKLRRQLLIAAIWVAASEWFRGTWPWHGLPWLYLGSTQTPALWMCQIADITGVAGLSFLIVVINAWIAMWVLNRFSIKGLVSSGILTILMLGSVIGYGIYRLGTEPKLLVPGPTVMVVQSNFPQSNTGAKGASAQDLVDFHFKTTADALLGHSPVDLTVWSETMMPPLNAWARQRYPDIEPIHQDLVYLTRKTQSAILTGGESITQRPGVKETDRRNTAYFYDHHGTQYSQRYDKIHLVPYGEFIPFKDSVPWLYKLAIHFGPPDMEAYSLVPGDDQHLTVFPLEMRGSKKAWRFVTPICFEDIDADICTDMFRPEDATPDLKRADFLVNITNDGWFKANENSQHVQAAIFRSIENRVSTARSVNTGISGFIDPLGRVHGLLPARTEGTSVQQLQIDPRVTFFTRYGRYFSWICAGITVVLVVLSILRWLKHLSGARAG